MTPRLDHLHPEIVPFPGPLSHTGKDRVSTVILRDVVDELHDDHRLANTRTTKGSNLTTLRERANQVDDLDAGFEDFGRGGLINKRRSRGVNRVALLVRNRTKPIHCVTRHIEDPAQDPGHPRER